MALIIDERLLEPNGEPEITENFNRVLNIIDNSSGSGSGAGSGGTDPDYTAEVNAFYENLPEEYRDAFFDEDGNRLYFKDILDSEGFTDYPAYLNALSEMWFAFSTSEDKYTEQFILPIDENKIVYVSRMYIEEIEDVEGCYDVIIGGVYGDGSLFIYPAGYPFIQSDVRTGKNDISVTKTSGIADAVLESLQFDEYKEEFKNAIFPDDIPTGGTPTGGTEQDFSAEIDAFYENLPEEYNDAFYDDEGNRLYLEEAIEEYGYTDFPAYFEALNDLLYIYKNNNNNSLSGFVLPVNANKIVYIEKMLAYEVEDDMYYVRAAGYTGDGKRYFYPDDASNFERLMDNEEDIVDENGDYISFKDAFYSNNTVAYSAYINFLDGLNGLHAPLMIPYDNNGRILYLYAFYLANGATPDKAIMSGQIFNTKTGTSEPFYMPLFTPLQTSLTTDGSYVLTPVEKWLPEVTASDAGKILMVNASGEWEAVSIPNADDMTF